MLILEVCRKNFISSLRGEYVDFLIGRITFTIISMATAYILYNLNSGNVSQGFIQATGSSNYLGYMVVGTALYSTTHGILLNVARTLMTERREGTLESVLLIPFQRWKYYSGNQLHQLMVSSLDLILALIIGTMLGVKLNLNITTVTVGLLLFFSSLYGLAMIISLVMIYFKDTFFIQNTLIPIVLVIGGYLFPIDVLPIPLKVLSDLLPIHIALDYIRQGTLSGTDLTITLSTVRYFIPGLVLYICGYLLLPVIERRAIEDYLS